MIQATKNIAIPDDELTEEFVRASGPGGQNVNKVASAVQLRFAAKDSQALPSDVKARLLRQQRSRLNDRGEIVIDAREHRSQAQNRQAAEERLVEMIRKACVAPKKRRKTKPTAASRRRRLRAKRQHGEKKRLRKEPGGEE